MTITLPVTKRDESTKKEVLRANGVVPAVVYGPKQVPLAVTFDEKVFDKVLKEAGESTIVELTGLGESIEVLIKDVDFNPIKRNVRHVDFYAIERGKEIETNVALHFVGEAPAEKTKAGVVNKVLHTVEVVCKPVNLPSHIDVDISGLVAVDDRIMISNLQIPAGVKVKTDADSVVVLVAGVKEESEEVSEPVDMAAVEVEQKGKTEAE